MVDYLGLKLLCVFSIGCIGSAHMFLPLFYKKELGLGTDKIGFLYSITPFVSFFALPYWTAKIDKTGQYKKIMFQNMLIALLSILSIACVPFVITDGRMTIAFVSVGCLGYAFFGYPIIVAVVDSLILQVLGDRKDLFGRQKVGLPIGFASSVFLTGYLSETSNYALFLVFGVFNVAFLITLLVMDVPRFHQGYGTVTQSRSMSHLLQDPMSIQFFAFMTLTGFSISVVQAFLYLYIENDLKGPPWIIGLLGPLGSSTEIICFYFSKQILVKFGSRGMLIASQCILIYRCITYIVCTEISFGVYVAILTQLLHGVGFSMMWSAGALQADALAPAHLKSTAQGLLNMGYNGIGSGIGALVAGYIYQLWGARFMWSMVAIVSLLSIILYTSHRLQEVVFWPVAKWIKKSPLFVSP